MGWGINVLFLWNRSEWECEVFFFRGFWVWGVDLGSVEGCDDEGFAVEVGDGRVIESDDWERLWGWRKVGKRSVLRCGC